MENEKKTNESKPSKKKSLLCVLWGILLLAFVVISFTGMTAVGGFLTYSFAFLFGAFFPVILVFLALFALFLVFRGIPNGKGRRLFVSGFFLALFALLALGSVSLISGIPDFSFPLFLDAYLQRMNDFSDTVFQVQNYSQFAALGGGFIGTFLFALFSSFMTIGGAMALFIILFIAGLALALFHPIRNLVFLVRKRVASRVEYTSPYQHTESANHVVYGEYEPKEKDPEIDPELKKPFSDSWYRDSTPTIGIPAAKRIEERKEEENPLLPKRAAFSENSLLRGYSPKDVKPEEDEMEGQAEEPSMEEQEPAEEKGTDTLLYSRSFFKSRQMTAKNPASVETEEDSVSSWMEESPIRKPEKKEPAPVPQERTSVEEDNLLRKSAPVSMEQRSSILSVPTKKEDSFIVKHDETEKEEEEANHLEEKILKTVPVFEAEPEIAPVESDKEKAAPKAAQKTERQVEEPSPKKAPAPSPKALDERLDKLASSRAEDFRQNSLEREATFEVLPDEEKAQPAKDNAPAKEDPLVAQAKSLKHKKVIEDHPHEFLVEDAVEKEEPPVVEEESEEEVVQRYFLLKRKKIEEEQEKKRQEEEARKAKVFKYVSPNGRSYDYDLPDDTLLEERDDSDKLITNNEAAQEKAKIINKVFSDFRIQAKAISFTIGASVTRFNIQMEPGVKSEKINSVLSELQIALNGDKSVRIETVVEGRTTSGIEIGNAAPMAVSFKEAFQEVEKHPESNLLLPIGKDISGHIITFPLDEMPHLLVAGTTGSGKSVLVHSFIMTLIMRNYPSQLKLMLIDPKQVEFAKYNLESHLYCPVISDAESAIVALQKLCIEMDRRYSVLKQWGCVKMSEYRKKRKGREDQMEEIPDVVCVIDEFADLMQTGGSEVSDTVQRIAQKARAAGIYLIIATQRPSKDVIPMVIKSNISCRIGLSCSTAVDSRVILDENGAETLLGRGDLLFRNPQKKSLIRAQSPYISNEEMDRVLAYIKENAGDPNYDPEFLDLEVKNEDPSNGKMEGEGDLYEDVKDFVMKTGVATKTALMRNFSISYSKADQFIARLRNEGVIQAIQGGKNVVVNRIPMEE